jgi:tRNA 2-thiouridine synthesizing protein C
MSEEMQQEVDGKVKKFMYVNRKAPYGTIYALESLEVVLVGAAFDQDVSLAFIDDGVFQLVKDQNTTDIGVKNFSPAFRALGDYDVNKLFVEKESLDERGLSPDDLMELTWEDEDDNWEEKPSIHLVSRQEMKTLLGNQDVILSF